MESLQSSIDSQMAKLEEESKEYEQLNSASKRARKKSVGEKVSHLMFRKSEAIRKHQMQRLSRESVNESLLMNKREDKIIPKFDGTKENDESKSKQRL